MATWDFLTEAVQRADVNSLSVVVQAAGLIPSVNLHFLSWKMTTRQHKETTCNLWKLELAKIYGTSQQRNDKLINAVFLLEFNEKWHILEAFWKCSMPTAVPGSNSEPVWLQYSSASLTKNSYGVENWLVNIHLRAEWDSQTGKHRQSLQSAQNQLHNIIAALEQKKSHPCWRMFCHRYSHFSQNTTAITLEEILTSIYIVLDASAMSECVIPA